MEENQKVIGIIILVVVLALALFWFARYKVNRGPLLTATPATTITPVNKVEEVNPSVLPKTFPKDIPIEKDAKIINNYLATAPDGRTQATRTFASAKSVKDNFTLYKNYLTKNGWKILGRVDDATKPELKSLFASNSSGNLVINITKSQTDPKGSIVTVNFLAVKK